MFVSLLSKKQDKKKYNPEQGFISKLVETKDMTLVKDQQIKSNFFTGDHKAVMVFIFEHFQKVGEVATVRVVEQKFPYYHFETYNVNGIDIVGTEESLNHWCSEMRIKAKHNKIADTVEEVVKKLEDFKSDDAFDTMQKALWNINNEINITTTIDITKNADARKELYIKRKENRGITGIPTGISKLDWILKGLVHGTLTCMIARTGIGKTWFQSYIGATAQLNNYKVLQFKTEMPTELMQDRYEVLLFNMMYGAINYNSFKMGMLPVEQERLYYQFLVEDLPNLEPMLIDTATDVSMVEAKIQSEKPDLVLIDGVYLMNDQQGASSDWLRIAHITRDLKKIAERYNIPIFINSQADKNTSKKTGPELESISFSQAIGQDCDNILALYQDELMFNDREMGVKVLKNREGSLGKVVMNWDFTTMDFSEIYSVTEEGVNNSENSTQKNIVGIQD